MGQKLRSIPGIAAAPARRSHEQLPQGPRRRDLESVVMLEERIVDRTGWPAHFVAIDALDPYHQAALFDRADEISARLDAGSPSATLPDKVVALLFLEPSTRTFLSFESAVHRLGSKPIIPINGSWMVKGESLADTLKVVSYYADLAVVRHSRENLAEIAQVSEIPIINAGDGGNEHPTQALLDLYSIRRHMGRLENLKVGVGFDPLHSRAIRSLCYALSRYEGIDLLVVAPEICQMSDADFALLTSRGVRVRRSTEVGDLRSCEIVYVNRFQAERHVNPNAVDSLRSVYRLTPSMVENSSIRIILDPLPRVGEVDEKVDDLPQAKYFQQAGWGLPLRMALIEKMMR